MQSAQMIEPPGKILRGLENTINSPDLRRP
jgi:hypothetical protein